MSQYLPVDPKAERIEYSEDLESERSEQPLIIESAKLGVANKKKIYAVCHDCNTGWMSRLENLSKPYLVPLITGEPIRLDDAVISELAKFVMLKVMVAEHDAFRGRLPMPIFETEERRRFKAAPYVPDGVRMWIAPNGGPKWRTGFYRYVGGVRLTKSPAGSVIESGFVRRGANIQSVTWGIGRFLVHLLATTDPKFDAHYEWEVPPGVTRIWPLDGSIIYWPPNFAFTDWAIDDMAHALKEISKTFPRVRSDGTLLPPR